MGCFKNNVYIKVFGNHLLNTHLSWQKKSSLSALAVKLLILICLDKSLGLVEDGFHDN